MQTKVESKEEDICYLGPNKSTMVLKVVVDSWIRFPFHFTRPLFLAPYGPSEA